MKLDVGGSRLVSVAQDLQVRLEFSPTVFLAFES